MQVHSVTIDGLHPLLAMVHRANGHTDIVLRETGQVVGREDELDVNWQRILDA